MTVATIGTEYITIPKIQYTLLKSIYDLNKKQQDFTRIYEVEENIKNGNYKKMNADSFINSI